MDVVKVWYETTAQHSQCNAIKWTVSTQIFLWMIAKSFLTLFQLFICLTEKALALWNAAIATASTACQIANNTHLLWISFLCILIIYWPIFLCYAFKVTYLFIWSLSLVLERWKRGRKWFRWSRLIGEWDSPRSWKLVKTFSSILRNSNPKPQVDIYTRTLWNFTSKCFIWNITYLLCFWEMENSLA